MTPRTLTAAAIALAASFFFAGAAQAGDQDGGRKAEGRKGGHALKKLDTDGDGRISREEAAAHPKLAERFAEIDANGDGYVTRDEAKAAREQHGKGGKHAEKKREKHEKKAGKGGKHHKKGHGRGHGKGKHHKKRHHGHGGRGNRG